MKKRLFSVLATVFCVSCATDSGSVTSPESPSSNSQDPVLTVVLGEGVEGYPLSTNIYRSRERVDYSYFAKEGYLLSGVVVDGVSANNAGSVVMISDHSLIVSAEMLPVISEENSPIVNAAEAVLSNPIRENYLHYLSEVVGVYETYDLASARRYVHDAVRSTFGSVGSLTLASMQETLYGEVFKVEPSADFSASILPNQTSTDIFYVNGIWTTQDEAAIALAELRKALGEASITEKYEVSLFYNQSEVKQNQKERCLLESFSRAGLGFSAAITSFIGCWGLPYAKDVAEATGQVVDLLGLADLGTTESASLLADKIKESRAARRNVIIVGHSQGALVAEEAINSIPADRCVSAVALGAPVGPHSWALTTEELSGVSSAGNLVEDIILGLGLNFFTRYSSDITKNADEEVEFAERMHSPYGTLGSIIYPDIAKFWQSVRLHSITGSYLAGDQTRRAIQDDIASQMSMFSERQECRQTNNNPVHDHFGVQTRGYDPGIGRVASLLYRIDFLSGDLDELVGPITSSSLVYDPFVVDIAIDSFGNIYALGSSYLYLIDPSSAEPLSYLWLQGMTGAEGLAVSSNGLLYTLSSNATSLLAIDPAVGNHWIVGYTSIGQSTVGDLVFSPAGKLYATVRSLTSGLWKIVVLDPYTGSLLSEKGLQEEVVGLFFDGDLLYGATTDSWLVKVDTQTGNTTKVRRLSFAPNGAGD